jgi:hypothetical protein
LFKGAAADDKDEVDSKVVEHVLSHGSDLSFTNYFWKNCEPHPSESKQYSHYANVLSKYNQGLKFSEISRETGVKPWSIATWTRFQQRPKLGYYLRAFLELGPPRDGWRWLSVNNTSGHAVPLGPFIQVPMTIGSWKDIEALLASLVPLGRGRPTFSLEYMFGFLLGVIVGDAAKKRQRGWHRHLSLVLSMRYDTSVRIGDFACECANAIGLKMRRMPNQERYAQKPHGFFVWESQSSPLIDWIFNICLGLEDDECTTYDPVRMEWALSGPEDFRKGLIQGMAESDGSVNISGQEVEFRQIIAQYFRNHFI